VLKRKTCINLEENFVTIFFLRNYFLKNNFDFVTNNGFHDVKKRTIPYGMDVSVFSYKSFIKMYNLAKKIKEMQEHPTMFFYTKGKNIFKIKNLIMPSKWHNKVNTRLTLDTIEDFKLIKKIVINFIKKKYFSLTDIYFFLRRNKFTKINQGIKQFMPKAILYNEK
jgi:spore coat polysaccharide biosynthesis protein SpsF